MNEVRSAGAGQAGLAVDSRYYLAPIGGAGWLAGIWLADATGLGAFYWLALAIPMIAGATIFWRRGRIGLVLAFGGTLALGGARYAAAQPPFEPGYIHYYNGAKDVVVRGRVNAEPNIGDTAVQLRLAVEELVIDGQIRPVTGIIQVQTGRYPSIPYGAALQLAGDLSDPLSLGDPGYAAYLERQGVRSVMDFPSIEVTEPVGGSPLYRSLLALKARSRHVIITTLTEPHASLLAGILLGDDSGMPRALRDDFRETGMTHIIAISGQM